MTKHYLMSQFKSTGTAYLLWFFFGCHYAYLGRWIVQIFYWISLIAGIFTFGITWIWCFADLFLIPGKIRRYNAKISAQIADIEKGEKEEEYQRNLAIAQTGKYQSKEKNEHQSHAAPNPVPETTNDENELSDKWDERQKNDFKKDEITIERPKSNKTPIHLFLLGAVLIASLFGAVYIFEPDIPILKNLYNDKNQTSGENVKKSESTHEDIIKELLNAEDERNFARISEYYNLKNMKRYWDNKNPTYDDLRSAYSRAWNITDKSSNKINSISEVREKVYDVNLDFTFYQVKKQEWKTVNNTVRYVFDQNNKIVEVYGTK